MSNLNVASIEPLPLHIVETAARVDYLWKCFNTGIINPGNRPQSNEGNDYNPGLRQLITEIEKLNSTLLSSNIPLHVIGAINTESACPDTHLQYKREFTTATNAYFNSVTNPQTNEVHLDVSLPAPENFQYNEKAICVENIWTPMATKFAISLGPEFVFSHRVTEGQIKEYKTMITDIEEALNDRQPNPGLIIDLKMLIPELRLDTPRRCQKTSDSYNNIAAFLRRCLYAHNRFMKQRPDLIMITADQGDICMIFKRDTYHGKFNEHIYEFIGRGIYCTVNAQLENIVASLTGAYSRARRIHNAWMDEASKMHNCRLDTQYITKIRDPIGNWTPNIYGRIKVHKDGNPIRPIVTDKNSILAAIQNCIKPILTHYIERCNYSFIIHSSAQLISNLNNFKNNGHFLKQGHCIYTAVFTTMYTNIDIKQCLDIIQNDYYKHSIHEFGISKQDLLELLNICLCEFNYIEVMNLQPDAPQYIRQTRGIPMSGKLSSALAEIVTSWALRLSLEKVYLHDVSFVYKYDGDLLIGCAPDAIGRITSGVLSILPSMTIKTTTEDANNTLTYLDVLFVRTGVDLLHTWYRKEYASNRMMNYFSGHDRDMKNYLYKEMLRHALEISNCKHQAIRNTFEQIMRANHFPDNVITEISNEFFTTQH